MPTIAAPTVVRLIAPVETIPFPMVAATAVPDIAPRRLKTLAIPSAAAGGSTRVETTVAMEFGASVQPLTNSAASTSPRTRRTGPSSILQDDAFDGDGDVLALVGGRLQRVVEVAPLHHLERVLDLLEQLGHGLPQEAVAGVLQTVDLDAVLKDVRMLERLQARDNLGDLLGLGQDHAGQLAERRADRRHLVEDEVLGRLLEEIEDVVNGGGQLMDILPVQRRDERPVELRHDLMRNLVAGMLQPLQPRALGRDVLKIPREVVQRLGRVQQILGGPLKQDKERLVFRDQ